MNVKHDTRRKDNSQKAAKQAAKVTKSALPKGESLLGSVELQAALAKAKSHQRRS